MATRGDGYQGDIAVDAITINADNCDNLPTTTTPPPTTTTPPPTTTTPPPTTTTPPTTRIPITPAPLTTPHDGPTTTTTTTTTTMNAPTTTTTTKSPGPPTIPMTPPPLTAEPPVTTTTTTANPQTTTTTTTANPQTTTTTPQATTTTVTTPQTPIDHDKSTRVPTYTGVFSCDFEDSENDGVDSENLCGMRQSNTDNFDWTRHSGKTKSFPTGPDAASSGNYYIYIEASNKKKGENAV